LKGHLWEQLELPRYTRRHLLLNLCNAAPLRKRKQIVTIHDAAVFSMPESYSFGFRNFYRYMLPALGKSAAKILTVSNFSKGQLQHYCHIAEAKLRVTYEGHEHVLATPGDKSILSKHGLTDKPYLLAVSSMSPSKNFAVLARALALSRGLPHCCRRRKQSEGVQPVAEQSARHR
jgi:glycosyltransferase involved in cell wall biosynthesis